LSDANGRGITVTEIAPMDQPIDANNETIAAFIGRALRGPLNTPVLIDNFAMFRRQFGGLWRHSSLGPAVQQYFDHGGKRMYIVRVASNARGAMICLPATGGVLVLHALAPGSTEKIRAAVDYDGIADDEHFNLTIQRIAPETKLVADQEIYLRLSCRESGKSYVVDALLNSALVSVQCPVPAGRPASTTRAGISFESSYVGHAQEGTDGGELTDYDLVGSAIKGAGMFALNQVDHFDLLYMPPPGKHRDVGPTAMLAAELFCRKRGAMLIMDPPHTWDSVEAAVDGLQSSGITSPNVFGYFPRVVATNSEDATPRVAGGAIAGLLCKLDRQQGPWEDLDQPGLGIDRKLVPACELSTEQAQVLVRRGLNVIVGNSSGRATVCGSVTMGYSKQLERVFANLTVRRLCLSITNDVEHAIRWAVFERNETRVAERIHSQVHAYMSGLADSGAFSDDNFLIQCDAGLHANPVDPHRGVTVLLAFRPAGSDETVALTLHQTVTGCRVAPTAFAPVIAQVA
jgi:phage tail sheath protein FI